MRQLVIETHPLPFCRRRKTVGIPESYDELSPEQFCAVVLNARQWICDEDFLARFFGLTRRQLSELDSYAVEVLSQTLAFLKTLTPVNRLLIPEVRVAVGRRKVLLVGPGPKLAGMSFQQFMTVDTFHAWYVFSEKPDYLLRFMAALYAPSEGGSDDWGEALQTGLEGGRDLMECAAVNWMLIKRWLSTSYPLLFPSQEGQGSGEHKKTRPTSWLPIFDALVDDDLTRIESYQALPAIDVIRVINHKIQEQKKHTKSK